MNDLLWVRPTLPALNSQVRVEIAPEYRLAVIPGSHFLNPLAIALGAKLGFICRVEGILVTVHDGSPCEPPIATLRIDENAGEWLRSKPKKGEDKAALVYMVLSRVT